MPAHPHHTDPEPLAGDAAHVWIMPYDELLPSAATVAICLSPREHGHARQLHDATARARFIITRGVLRHVLGHYLAVPANAVELLREQSGRLVLAGRSDLHFSLSHSGDLAVVALARRSVGVDIERVRELPQWDRIARRILHPGTAAALRALQPSTRTDAFIEAWTQREAHVKAVGGGLFRTPDELPWYATPAVTDAGVAVMGEPGGTDEWSLARFSPARDYRGAIVARGVMRRIDFATWTIDRRTT